MTEAMLIDCIELNHKSDLASAELKKIGKKIDKQKNNDLNKTIRHYNARLEPYKVIESKFKSECASKYYYEDDYKNAVRKVGYGM
jgi:hypothetical protein